LIPAAQASSQLGTHHTLFNWWNALHPCLDAQLLAHLAADWFAVRLNAMQATTQAQEVVDPELLIEGSLKVEELRLPTVTRCTGQRLVEAHACWGAVQLWELALLGDAKEHLVLHAEGVPNFSHFAGAVLAKLLTFTSKEWIADVPDNPSAANAILEPPTIRKHAVAVQVVVNHGFALLAKR